MKSSNGTSYSLVAGELLAAGMCVVPCRVDKHPTLDGWKAYQKALPVADELDEWFGVQHPFGIGFVCGLVSGGLEVLDFDAKHDPTGTLNQRAEDAIRKFAPGLWERLPVERTPSGGMHVYFRCAEPAKNLKLARCKNAEGKLMAIAETRGENDFIVAAPTPGYVMVQGMLTNPPVITDDERAALFAAARSLDQSPEPIRKIVHGRIAPTPSSFPAGFVSPGDAYDASEDWATLLQKHGWTEVHAHGWRRPGKDRGISATWDTLTDCPRQLYVFSPNAHPLEDDTHYSPFSLFAHLECGGDFKLAAERLYEMNFGTRRKPRPERIPDDAQADIDRHNETYFSQSDESATEPRIFPGDRFIDDKGGISGTEKEKIKSADDWPEPISIADLCANPPNTPEILIEGLLYAGGTMLLSGPSKSHKTFSAFDLAVAIATGGKWLGHQCTGAPVLYLNLELQDFDTEKRMTKIISARGVEAPKNLHVWNLRGRTVSITALVARLPAMIAKFGIRAVVIDPHYKVSAVSDMEENSNDSQGKLLTLLEGLCTPVNAALVLTHHFAKGDASQKNAIDRASGGGVFARWGDVMLTFTPHEEEDAMTIEMSLRNFAPVVPFVVRWEYPRWVRDKTLNPEDLKTTRGPKEKNTADSCLRALDGPMGFKEWQKATGMSDSTFKRKRQELMDDGRVEIVGNLYRKTG